MMVFAPSHEELSFSVIPTASAWTTICLAMIHTSELWKPMNFKCLICNSGPDGKEVCSEGPERLCPPRQDVVWSISSTSSRGKPTKKVNSSSVVRNSQCCKERLVIDEKLAA